ncbi:NHL repeat-containing protein [Arthrobacter sp. TMN-49]
MTQIEPVNSHGHERRSKGSSTVWIGGRNYQWESVWPDYDGRGWQHSGIAVLQDGSVVFAHPEGRALVRVFTDGTFSEISTELTEMHSLLAGVLDGEEVIWAADNGTRYCESAPEYDEELFAGRVVALGVDGAIRQELFCPDLPVYKDSGWRPTTIAVDAVTGDIWVGDGYGASLVHCFTRAGQLRLTLDGTETGVAFASPHGIHIRRSAGARELYVADRSNKRLVVFGLDGTFRRIVGEGHLTSPSSIADLDGTLLVTELSGAVAVFAGDNFIGHVGASQRDTNQDAWPNRRDSRGSVVRKDVRDGVFNSPHGITVSGEQILVTEWMIGGRVTRLSPVA